MMNILLNFLLKNGYKQLKETDFKSKVKEYFGISGFSKEQDVSYFSHPRGYEIDLKQQYINTYEVEPYFLQEMKILEKGISDEYNARFLLYNKIIFNNDISSITQVLHDKGAIEDIVLYFDYEHNQMLMNLALNNLDTNNDEIIYIEHLVFYNNKTQKEPIKKNLLLKILEKHEDFFIKILQSLVEYWEEFITDNQHKYYAVAFMLEEFLKKHHEEENGLSQNKSYLILNNLYLEKRDLEKYFSAKKYFGFQLLTNYSETYNLLDEQDSDEGDVAKYSFVVGDILRLYPRADFSSYAQEIVVKGEVEFLGKISGWDYVRVNGMVGYLQTEEVKKEKEETEKKKYSFLAEEDEAKPEKKKGFWDSLLG